MTVPSPTAGSSATPARPSKIEPSPQGPGHRKSKIERLLAYRGFWLVAIAVYGLDQLTKGLIAARIPYPTYGPPGHFEVIP